MFREGLKNAYLKNRSVPAPPCRAVVLIAIAAVYRSPLCRLERNFTFLAAVGAHGFVHLARLPVIHRLVHLRLLISLNSASLW
ncbi:MAG: hypothetical protein QHH00_08435 [Methanomassiliicoccales archaeon]|nr:hypothetical protein [Methanomassiliicoccales archaeon]